MRKIGIIILAVIIICSFYSCSTKGEDNSDKNNSETPLSVNDNEKTYEEKSKSISKNMISGDFNAIYSLFTDDVKKQVTLEKLKSAWNTMVNGLGEFKEFYHYGQSNSEGNKTITTYTTLKFQNNGIILSLSFTNDSVSGINLAPFLIKSAPISNENFEETFIKIGDGDYKVDGILTTPKNAGNYPVAILIQGSGQSDMDETIGKNDNKPFQDIAQKLAENGVASIRYNKRYYQFAETVTDNLTIQDEVINDVNLAVNMAKTTDGIDKNKIFLIGHSLGGMLAPSISDSNNDVAGFISLAGSPRNLEDIIIDQTEQALNEDTSTPIIEKEAYIGKTKKEAEKIKNITPDDNSLLLNVNGIYWYSLNQLNTKKCIENTKKPCLILQGSADFQIFPETDYVLWKEMLKNNSNASFKLYEGLNHLFMKTENNKKDITVYDEPNNVDETVIKDMANFIKK